MLYLVATPIGNLKDITLRALDVLKEADYIACEDTRRALILLNAYGIKKPLIIYQKHNEKSAGAEIIDLLKAGKSVALISDAGMPAVSDPGAALVAAAREEGIPLTVIPGASAAVAAFALSGIESGGFTFLGFIEGNRNDKVSILQKQKSNPLPLVVYSAPHDLETNAEILYSVLGDRKVWAVKEITKIHETVTISTLRDFSAGVQKGEFVLIIEGAKEESPLNALSVEEHLKHYLSAGISKKNAVKIVAEERGASKNDVYKAALGLE
ncbi:MAG TPA: 16S rRNA (cytidine(1402)-2'-O)-methyltransferase [Eubacteriales bacterium]|jgi:16S rRNA (cytidine1402-2'-O)-methyltransferase|nr:16S rRNA (cytidine(1402)-2'-O)-methyltransferase [Clostridia bacterium]HRR90291.1 16S rRNA (cytidine(1402)-2'-O)-methyltransferase [Eubacteriales bacterium]HRU84891.1 16S rRNA (cytidine(1402)-2'-O)-methyltransferase [Eubacteriales bacterium]